MATGLMDYLEAIGEAGATLGSGAAASLAGIPYGILQNIKSGKFGTKEGVRLADKATEDFIKQYTYAPRSQMAQNALQSVAGLMEKTKLPPILPEAGLLAAIPKTAYAAQLERAGMAAERAMEPVAANVMARGGLPAQLLQDLTQGTVRNVHLENTPKKPNPLVGTRYQTEQLPGIVPRRPVDYEQMRGGSMITYPTDQLSRNVKVTNVSDIPLGNNSFVTPGGLMYMMDENNIARQIGYASNEAAARAQNNRALQAMEENLKMGGTGRVFMAPHTMPKGGENFSTGPTLGLLSLIDATNPSPKLLNQISDQMRAMTVKGTPGKYKDFVGLNDPMARLQLLTGEGLAVGSPGDLRKVFVDKMSNVAAEKGLGFNYADLQNAMLDPNVMYKQPFLMGDSIFEALPKLGISPGTHGAYGYDIPGIFLGNTRGAPISEFMQPVYNKILPTQMNKPGPSYGKASLEDLFTQIQMPGDIPVGRTYADPHQLTRGKLSTAGENISLFMDDKEIKRLKTLLGD